MRYFTKTRPKKAGKQNVIDITNQITSWTPHTVTSKSGKVIRKSDIYKHLGADPRPETADATANRQLIRHAACKTVAGQKRLDQTVRAEFAKFQKRKSIQNPIWAKSFDESDNQLPDDVIRAPKKITKDPTTGEELPDAPQAIRQSGRARKATDISGSVAIDHIKKAPKRKRSVDKTIFDSVEEGTDSAPGIASSAPAEDAEKLDDLVEVEKPSNSNAVIKAVKAPAAEEKAKTTPATKTPVAWGPLEATSLDLQADVSEEGPTGSASIMKTPVKLVEKDLAIAGTEAKMRGVKHSTVFKTRDTHGTPTSLGRYEIPQSIYMRPIGWGNPIFPAHIERYYPKPRVPRCCLGIPNYTRTIRLGI